MIVPVEGIKFMFDQLMQIKLAREEQNIVLERIKLRYSTLSKPLLKSIDCYYSQNKNSNNQEENSTLLNFQKCLQSSYDLVKKIENRKCFSRYLQAKQDLVKLVQCLEYVKDSVELIKNEKDLIELSLAKRQQEKQLSNLKTLNKNIQSQEAANFWVSRISEDQVQERIDNLANYFYQDEFQKLQNFEEYKKPYAIKILLNYLDQDGNGYADQKEFSYFYQHFWENQVEKDKLLKQILQLQEEKLTEDGQIMYSILDQCQLALLLPKFQSMKFDSQSFLMLRQNELAQLTSPENAMVIHTAIQNYQNYLKQFDEIKSFILSIQKICYELIDKYSQKPQEWKEGLTGICRVYSEIYGNDIIIYATNGACAGPFFSLEQIENGLQSYQCFGYMQNFVPGKSKPLCFYEFNNYKPSKINMTEFGVITYQYTFQNDTWCLVEFSPFKKYYSKQKRFNKKNINMDSDFHHGPTVYINGSKQVRLYYYQDENVSYEDYIERCQKLQIDENLAIPEIKYCDDSKTNITIQ